jgi:hypothetical protein
MIGNGRTSVPHWYLTRPGQQCLQTSEQEVTQHWPHPPFQHPPLLGAPQAVRASYSLVRVALYVVLLLACDVKAAMGGSSSLYSHKPLYLANHIFYLINQDAKGWKNEVLEARRPEENLLKLNVQKSTKAKCPKLHLLQAMQATVINPF